MRQRLGFTVSGASPSRKPSWLMSNAGGAPSASDSMVIGSSDAMNPRSAFSNAVRSPSGSASLTAALARTVCTEAGLGSW